MQQMGAQGPGGSPAPQIPPPSPSMMNIRHLSQALNSSVQPGAV
jgi:hypothetical protein